MAKGNTKHLEHDDHHWEIGRREGTSNIEPFRNFQTVLKSGGFTVDFADFPGQLFAHKGNSLIFIDNRGSFYCQTLITTAA
jgi:hypothetical protein